KARGALLSHRELAPRPTTGDLGINAPRPSSGSPFPLCEAAKHRRGGTMTQMGRDVPLAGKCVMMHSRSRSSHPLAAFNANQLAPVAHGSRGFLLMKGPRRTYFRPSAAPSILPRGKEDRTGRG